MKHGSCYIKTVPTILEHLDLVEQLLKRSRFGLITDADGTISPTAPTPQQARVSPLCYRYLSILRNQLALVAVISGRAVQDLKDMVNIEGVQYVGNHGMERWIDDHSEFTKEVGGYPAIIQAAVGELAPLLSIEGIIIENKGITATIHYRLCRDHRAAKRDIMAVLSNSASAKGLRIMQENKYAINLLPPVEVSKGTAVLELIKEYDLRSGVYLGDDITDIDAFRALRSACHDMDFRGLAIGIAGPEMPEELTAEVDFTLNGVRDVERFLEWMSRTTAQPSKDSTNV